MLYGRRFTVYTDHRALKWLLNLQDPSSKLTRWAMKLSEYDYVVEHRPGTQMRHADALSRNVQCVETKAVLSKELIKEEQDKDELCARYKQYENFWIDNDGILYRQEAKTLPRIVIPTALISTVLKCYHELPFTAHQGVRRTIEFINRKYWWEGLRDDVSEFIRKCDACAKRKTGNKIKAPMGDAIEAHEFFDVVSLDVVGPVPVTTKGNKYLLTFVDHYTRFCEAIPIAKQDTETIARSFVTKIITQFGVPKKLLTDRGANFTSALIKETCKLLKIQKLQTSSFRPQANDICERMHKLLVDMLSHFVRKDAKDWDEYVPYAVMAYRAMPHCTLKYSPYYLVYGRDMRLPIEDDWKPNLGNKEIGENEYEEHIKALAARLQEANKIAGQQSKLSHTIAKRYYDRQVRFEKFKKGDLVYVHDPTYKRGKAKKFSYQYKGPFAIEQRISPLIYKVRMADGASVILHVNRLKGATGDNGNEDRMVPIKYSSSVDQPIHKEKKADVKKSKGFKTEIIEVKEEPLEVDTSYTSRLPEEESKESETFEESDVGLARQSEHDPEWRPGSLYSQRSLRKDETADNIAYRLRSRLVSRSRQEAETDKRPAGAQTLLEDTNVNTNERSEGERVENESTVGHSYNLRNRV